MQHPFPEIRIAASQPDTYDAIGRLGYPLFSAVRASPLGELAGHARAYREAWAEAGHPGRARLYLQVPVYVAETASGAGGGQGRYDAVFLLPRRSVARASRL